MSDPQAEDSPYASAATGPFVGIDLGNGAAPDKLTICKSRQLIKDKRLSQTMLKVINDDLKPKGMRIDAFIAS